jgi:hypothetical protein
VAGCGENSSEPLGCIKCGEFLESLSSKEGLMLHRGSQSVMICEELKCSGMPEKRTKTIASSRKSSYFLLIYLLTYLLHGAESFLRS